MNDIIKRESDDLSISEVSKPRIRLYLRKIFESDLETRKILEHSNPTSDAKSELLKLLEWSPSDGPTIPEVMDELLNELEHQRKMEPGLLLIDEKTGKMVMKLREGAIYQPPDYIGEDGVKRKAKPIVHPGITAPLMMKVHEEGKMVLAANNSSAQSLKAITDPNSIIRQAEEKLREMGWDIGPIENGITEEIEIGREYYDPLQSKNDKFHRHQMFGDALACKIAARMETKKCELSSIVSKSSSKQRWYIVSVKFS
jgi:hypothetical protein